MVCVLEVDPCRSSNLPSIHVSHTHIKNLVYVPTTLNQHLALAIWLCLTPLGALVLCFTPHTDAYLVPCQGARGILGFLCHEPFVAKSSCVLLELAMYSYVCWSNCCSNTSYHTQAFFVVITS